MSLIPFAGEGVSREARRGSGYFFTMYFFYSIIPLC